MSIEGLMRYLLGDDNQVDGMESYLIAQDMEQPLAHYFIKSSHNTYLTGEKKMLPHRGKREAASCTLLYQILTQHIPHKWEKMLPHRGKPSSLSRTTSSNPHTTHTSQVRKQWYFIKLNSLNSSYLPLSLLHRILTRHITYLTSEKKCCLIKLICQRILFSHTTSSNPHTTHTSQVRKCLPQN